MRQSDDQFQIWDVGNWHFTLDVRESSQNGLASILKVYMAQVCDQLDFLSVDIFVDHSIFSLLSLLSLLYLLYLLDLTSDRQKMIFSPLIVVE